MRAPMSKYTFLVTLARGVADAFTEKERTCFARRAGVRRAVTADVCGSNAMHAS